MSKAQHGKHFFVLCTYVNCGDSNITGEILQVTDLSDWIKILSSVSSGVGGEDILSVTVNVSAALCLCRLLRGFMLSIISQHSGS